MKPRHVFRDWLIDSGIDLAPGETSNGNICPFCNGGNNRDKSFSVTLSEAGYLYHCYRAKCEASGVYAAQAPGNGRTERKAKAPQTYDWTLVPVSEIQRSTTPIRCITPQEVQSNGILYNETRNSFAFPIRDYRGYDVGVLDRSYAGRRPKGIQYWFNSVPHLHFPYGTELFKEAVVLVEDQLSAIVATRYTPSIALLGCHLTEDSAKHLARFYKRAIFALDADATYKASKLSKTYNLFFADGCRMVQLFKDIKDMSRDELDDLFDYIGNY